METRHVVASATILSLLVIAVVAAVGVSPAVLAQETNETADEGSFGAQVSAFAQSTAADANGTVDAGMWAETVTDSDDPAAAVDGRTAALEQRLERLQNRTAELEAERANMSGMAYTAQASAVHAQLVNLQRHVNETTQVAKRHGVDSEKLTELRAAAGNATGPEIAALARNITDAGQGPPDWAGLGDDDKPDAAGGQGGNGTAGPPDNRTGGQGNNNGGGGGAGGDGGDGTGQPRLDAPRAF